MVSGIRFAPRPRAVLPWLAAVALLGCPLLPVRAQDPAAMPGAPAGAMPPGQPGAPPPSAPPQSAAGSPEDAARSFLISNSGGLPWEVAVMFTVFWILMAAEIAIISKPSKRLEKPPKIDKSLQPD